MVTARSAVLGRTNDHTENNKVKQTCSTAWTDEELFSLLDYAKGSSMRSITLLRIFQRGTTDPSVFNVPIRHFKEVTDYFPSSRYQMPRVTMNAAMYGASRDTKEVRRVGGRGKIEPNVINKEHLEAAAQIPQAELDKVEAFLKAVYEKYWEEMQPHAHCLGQVLVKEFCEFLKKAGEVWTKVKPDTTFESLRDGYANMETSLRKYLIKGGANLGERILEEPVQKMDAKAIAAINKEEQSELSSSVPYIKFDKEGTCQE